MRFVGDIEFDGVAAKAEAITPVPGGVGPITDVWLDRERGQRRGGGAPASSRGSAFST